MDIRLETLLLLIFFALCVCSRQHTFVKFVQDFVSHQNISPQVYIFLCSNIGKNTLYLRTQNVFHNRLAHLTELPRYLNTPLTFNKFQSFEIDTDIVNPNKVLFIIDLSCTEANEFLENKVDSKYFASPYRWLMIRQADKNTFRHAGGEGTFQLPQIQALPDSNIVLAVPKEEFDEVQLIQFYKIHKYSKNYIWEKYGKWSSTEGVIVSQTDLIISWRRRNLMGMNLTASYVATTSDTLNHLDDYVDTHIDSTTKNSYILVKHLIAVLNATQQQRFVSNWGYKNATTGQWSGMVRDLQNHFAEIGGSSLYLTDSRLKVIDYLSMVSPTVAMFLFREPPLSYVTDICLLPFSRQVWLSISVLVALAMVAIFITLKFQCKKLYAEDEDHTTTVEERHFRPSDYVVNAIAVICQMGSLMQPRFASARIAIIFIVIAFFFFHTSYTAQIVALLQSTTKSIRTLKDLLESQLTLASDETPFARHYFGILTEPVRKAIYEKKMLTPNGPRFLNISTGVAEVRKGLFAFYVELPSAYKIIERTYFAHEKCNLMGISYTEFTDTWFAVQKHTPYREMFKVNIIKMREHGIQKRENLKIYAKKPICSTNGQSFGSVRITDCYAAIVVLVAGYVLSFLFLILEKLLRHNVMCSY